MWQPCAVFLAVPVVRHVGILVRLLHGFWLFSSRLSDFRAKGNPALLTPNIVRLMLN